MLPSIHQRYDDDILIDATVTSTPDPMDTYTVDTLLTHRPADRVRWAMTGSPSGSVRIRFELGGGSPAPEQRADLLVIPCWNVDEGSSVATLESDTGMNVAITVDAMMPSGIPRTTAIDLTLLEPNATKRTSNAFDLIVAGNSVDLIMGGAVMLYGPMRTFTDRDWRVGFQRSLRSFTINHENDYGTDLVYPRRTRRRQYTMTTLCTESEALDLQLWADANFGSGLPGLLWPIPDVYEAYFGRLEDVFTERVKVEGIDDAVEIALVFTELSKGKPIA